MFFNVATQADKQIDVLRAFELTPSNVKDVAPIDDFVLALTDKPFEIMSDEELAALPLGSTFIVDVECYENYFLIACKSTYNGKVVLFELPIDTRKLLWLMSNFATVGFNSINYDIPLIRVALQGFGSKFLKGVSNWIIFDNIRPWQVEQKYNLITVKWNHVDLVEVAPLQGSLKLYAGRLHCKRMQDLPYEHDSILEPEEIERLVQYCVNDLDNTELLLNELCPQIALRCDISNVYGLDVRSRSDAQIAEYVIVSELEKLNGKKPVRPEIAPGKTYYYTPPTYIKYKTQQFQEMLDVIRKAKFVLDENGSIQMPKEIGELKLKLGSCVYRMGIGGLHSSEKSTSHIADAQTLLVDRDVASYYPSIILNQQLFPKHLGRAFLTVYKSIVDRRLEAKRTGDTVTADSLKITINGSFGKLGSKWSALYAPDLLIQVTVTGQLALLLLIEMLELVDVPVVSANTDGVLIKCPIELESTMLAVVKQWETDTAFLTEEARYKAVYSRDVNNYIAIKPDGKTKLKGAYSEKGSGGNTVLSKNAENLVCTDAVIAYLTNAVPIQDTIKNCKDIRRFVTIRNVKGGAVKSDVYVGKTIRWYYSTEMQGEINYKLSGNKVPNSDRAMPLMELTETLPDDLDYERYIAVANEMLVDLGLVLSTQNVIVGTRRGSSSMIEGYGIS